MADNTKKYSDVKFFINKLNNVFKKLNIEKFRYKYGNDFAFVNFNIDKSWYQINHSTKNADKNTKSLAGSDMFAEIVLSIEELSHLQDRGICSFQDIVSVFELKAGAVKLPDCFKKLGFDGRYMPSKKHVDYKYNDLAKVLHPDSAFGDMEKFNELNTAKEECYKFLENNKEAFD